MVGEINERDAAIGSRTRIFKKKRGKAKLGDGRYVFVSKGGRGVRNGCRVKTMKSFGAV